MATASHGKATAKLRCQTWTDKHTCHHAAETAWGHIIDGGHHTALPYQANGPVNGTDFSSDVGRKKFGFSHEEMDDSFTYYEGQFKLYQRCGEGVLHCPESGAKYVGQFLNDKFHGDGDQTWPDGSRYIGRWKNGMKNGQGKYITADGLTYSGQWVDSRRHGLGIQTYANQDVYEGLWYHGLCSGQGNYQFADGSRYEGAWANGRYDGPGMMYGSDGARERQRYNGGLLMKREVLPALYGPKKGRRDFNAISSSHGAKVLLDQSRDDMHRPTALRKPQAMAAPRETAFVKVGDIRPDSTQVNTIVQVVSSEDKLQCLSAPHRRFAEVVVGDETGIATLRMQCTSQRAPYNIGETLVLRGARVEMFDGRLRLELGRWGRAAPIDGLAFPESARLPPGARCDVSGVEFALVPC